MDVLLTIFRNTQNIIENSVMEKTKKRQNASEDVPYVAQCCFGTRYGSSDMYRKKKKNISR